MKIFFANSGLTKVCTNRSIAHRKLGTASAKKLRHRLDDLAAASQVGELIAGKPHPLVGDRSGQFSISLSGGDRLVFEPADDQIPRLENGQVDWPKVTAALIVFIGDYHD